MGTDSDKKGTDPSFRQNVQPLLCRAEAARSARAGGLLPGQAARLAAEAAASAVLAPRSLDVHSAFSSADPPPKRKKEVSKSFHSALKPQKLGTLKNTL